MDNNIFLVIFDLFGPVCFLVIFGYFKLFLVLFSSLGFFFVFFWFLLVLFDSFWFFYFFVVDIFVPFWFFMVLFYFFLVLLGSFFLGSVLFCFLFPFYFYRVLFGVHTFSWPTFVNILPNKRDVMYHTHLAGSNLPQCIGSTGLTQIPNTLVH